MKAFTTLTFASLFLFGVQLSVGQSIKVQDGAHIVATNGNHWTVSGNGSFTTATSGGVALGNLVIKDGTLTLQNQSYLTVNGALTIDGNLVLESGSDGTASLITFGSVNGANALVKRYLPGSSMATHFLSSPVSAQSIANGFASTTANYEFQTWYESSELWVNFKDSINAPTWVTVNGSNNFVPGRGYKGAFDGQNLTKSFVGQLNSGSITIPLSASGTQKGHFNLVGNPYPSSIDWKAASGWDRSKLAGIEKCFWIWNNETGNYGAYSSAAYDDKGTNGVSRYIPSGQGFFVQASESGTFSMGNAIRVHASPSILKSEQTVSNVVSLILTSGSNGLSDETRIEFDHPASDLGAPRMVSELENAPGVWYLKNDIQYSLNFLPDFVDSLVIPISFKAGVSGNYTFTQRDGQSFEFQVRIILEDRQTNQFTNMVTTPSGYTFQVEQAGEYTDRFYLHFKDAVGVETQMEQPAFKVFGTNSQIRIISLTGKTANACVYDMTGRLLAQTNVASDKETRLNLETKGVFIVSLTSENKTTNYKIILP